MPHLNSSPIPVDQSTPSIIAYAIVNGIKSISQAAARCETNANYHAAGSATGATMLPRRKIHNAANVAMRMTNISV